jgi:hypothetical protein
MESVKTIPSGIRDGSNISIVGDMYSMYNGWMVGALHSVDTALRGGDIMDSLK